MNFFSLTHNRLLILLIIGLNVLAACDPSQTGLLRDPGGVASDSAPYVPEESSSTASITPAVQSTLGSQILSSYSGSYALLIGESQYASWPNLESIPGELREVEKVLQSQGFKVEKSFNLNAEEFTKRFKLFINKYGFEENNRLLFFYSGHGYTRKAKGTHKDKGYIVPVDAANPNFDETAFVRKAVGMKQIITWAQEIEAKHVLFLFDSCFSGAVFKARNLPKIPRQISQAAQLPIRQFITAGSANETVPAQSVFTPVFVDALRYGFGDTNKDGYVTGQELGLHLWNKVPQHTTKQTPQYGKIKEPYELSRGDFVFVVGSGNQVVAQSPTPVPVAPVPAPIPIKPPPIVKRDSDRDGVTDDQDKCPRNTTVEISKGVYKSGSRKGCPIDSDNDRVPDYRDNCPRNNSKEISQGVDSRGCPTDSDRDGIADYKDSCPKTSSGIKVTGNGCPVPQSKFFRDRLADGSLGPEMAWIPAGSFRMGDIQGGGDSDEKPVHRVSVGKFAMGRYEVTFAEYDKFASATGREKPDDSDRDWGRGKRPVINVSWNDAVAYVEWLSEQTGYKYRLPTEAEWEYAARAGTSTKYWWGNKIGKNRAACNGCGAKWGWDAKRMTAPVGSFKPNQFGLYDTMGNVWEWTCSEYESKYKGKEWQCAKNINENNSLSLRGGSWYDHASRMRSADRNRWTAAGRNDDLGFRVARF